LAIMNYEKPDALPVVFVEPYESFTLDCWKKQGLPENMPVAEFLGLDQNHKLPLHLGPIPAYEEKTVAEDAEHITKINGMGNTLIHRKDAPGMYYGHVDYPVKCREDWLEYKERFQVRPERNYATPEMAKRARESDTPVILDIFPYFMRLGFYSMGMERFLTAFYDMPDLMHEMFSYWNGFVLEMIKPILGLVRPDVVSLSEDLAFKNGPHISPAIYKEFWLPYQNMIVEEAKRAGAANICMYTSGDCRALLPLMMENGIDLTWPLDQYSNMDPIELRRKYGKGLRLLGGISKQTLTDGPEAIDRRLDDLMPLILEGGFIPAPDDMIPPEVPLKHVVYFVKKLREIRF